MNKCYCPHCLFLILLSKRWWEDFVQVSDYLKTKSIDFQVILGEQVSAGDIMVHEYQKPQSDFKSRTKLHGLGSSFLNSECLSYFIIEILIDPRLWIKNLLLEM